VPGVGRVATRELKEYRKSCEAYAVIHKAYFHSIKDLMAKNWGGVEHFKVDYFFVFNRSRLYNKQGGIKKLDVANRIKAVQDCFFAQLGIDDKHVWASNIEKMDGENECCHIVLSAHTPINAIELMSLFSEQHESPTVVS